MVSKYDELYYKEELRYLTSEGRSFAVRHPDIGRFLGLDDADPSMRDPHTERIIESFAFMSARTRRFMESRFPELTHALFNLICPLYLRPLPAKTIVAMRPQKDMLDKPYPVPKGTAIFSQPPTVGAAPIEFTTCQEVVVQPVDLPRVYVDGETGADFSLSLVLKTHGAVTFDNTELDKLEWYIHGSPGERYELFNHLARELTAIRIKNIPTTQGALQIHWSGFDGDHNLTPEDDGNFTQLYLLRDYFDFPARFGFFKIKGLQKALAPHLKDLTTLQIDFIFKKPFSSGVSFDHNNLKLFCCVAQNLFKKNCEPIKIKADQFEYPIVPDLTRSEMEVHHLGPVVSSFSQKSEEITPYYQVSSHGKGQRFYTIRREAAVNQGWSTMIRFVDLKDDSPVPMLNHNISVQAWCTNRDQAQNLKVGQINVPANSVPETISAANITQPTRASWPELHATGEWDFLSHLALNFQGIASRDRLRRLLQLYNIPGHDWAKRKINGLLEMEEVKDYRIIFGQAVTGRKIRLLCDESHFQHIGDIALFCRVMAAFLRSYCPINSFISLEIRCKHAVEIFTAETAQ